MKKTAWFLSIFLLLSAASGVCLDREVHTVSRVTDGDTLVLDNGQKVRLIGVDTPEIHDKERNGYDAKRSGRDIQIVNAYAGKAKKYVAGLIEGGEVALEFESILSR
jgi:micrococcal nuclease